MEADGKPVMVTLPREPRNSGVLRNKRGDRLRQHDCTVFSSLTSGDLTHHRQQTSAIPERYEACHELTFFFPGVLRHSR